jgi:hypothetical protein
MNTRLASRWFWPALAAMWLTIPFFPNNAASQPQGGAANANVKTAGGLTVVTFTVDPGKIIVNLPDDLRAGDTISGTVVAEPKGQTPEERAKNMLELNGYVIELETPKKPDGTPNPKTKAAVTAPIPQLRITLPPGGGSTPPVANVSGSSGGRGTTVTNSSGLSTIGTYFQGYYLTASITTDIGGLVFGTAIPVEEVPLSSLKPQSVENHIYELPAIGQQGRPIVITGPFDGNSSNTTLNWCINLTPACEQNPSTGGVIAPLAESPRKAVFHAPANVSGPMDISLKEGAKETKGTFRNVGVNLTAPKTRLLKGESTELKVEVQGLQGITQPVPLHLTKGGVVTMQGGDMQTMSIKPAEVQSNGTFATTRTITGVQSGVWNATATVVVFDVCLQDDNNGNAIIFSSETGDYVFCQTRTPSSVTVGGTDVKQPPSPANTPIPGPAGIEVVNPGGLSAPRFRGFIYNEPLNIGTIWRNGCTIDLKEDTSDRHVQAHADRCTQSGSATVQLGPLKPRFTITDRDTRNNTCACK